MIRNQGPGVTLCLGFFEDVGEPFQKRLAVLVVEKDLSTFYSPGHYVLEKAWGVKSWLAGHFVFVGTDVADCTDFGLNREGTKTAKGFLVFSGSGQNRSGKGNAFGVWLYSSALWITFGFKV